MYTNHSMAKGNLNKTEKNKTKTTTYSMKAYNLGDYYQQKLKSTPQDLASFIKCSKTVSYEVNLALQCSHLEVVKVGHSTGFDVITL